VGCRDPSQKRPQKQSVTSLRIAGGYLDPFATPFGLKNDGYQTLSKITFACGVNYLDTATRPPRRRDSPEIGLEMARIFGIARFAAQLLAFRGGQTKGRPAGGRPLFSARP
jgi:hypothetical protein